MRVVSTAMISPARRAAASSIFCALVTAMGWKDLHCIAKRLDNNAIDWHVQMTVNHNELHLMQSVADSQLKHVSSEAHGGTNCSQDVSAEQRWNQLVNGRHTDVENKLTGSDCQVDHSQRHVRPTRAEAVASPDAWIQAPLPVGCKVVQEVARHHRLVAT